MYALTVTNQTDRPLTIDQAATVLGISREAVRLRLRRGTLRGSRTSAGWSVTLGRPHAVTDQIDQPSRRPTDRPGRERHEGAVVAELRSQLADVTAEREHWRAAFEREQTASAELRRLLAGVEQQLADQRRALLAAPASEPEAELISVSAPSLAEVDAELRDAGVKGKKKRRKLLDRLIAAWRRDG